MSTLEVKKYLKWVLEFWDTIKPGPYIVKILDCYIDQETGDTFVKYHIANKRISGQMPVSEFVKTPMIFGVHPEQLYLIGYDSGANSERLKILHSNDTSIAKKIKNTFKRVFHG